MDEKQLLEEYVNERRQVESLDEQLEEAKKRMRKAEENLIKAMEDIGASATAKYDNLGRFQICKPSLRVSIVDGKEDDAYKYLENIGEGDLIRRTIHWKSLSSILGDRLESGNDLPPFFDYYFQPSVKWEKP